MSLLPLKDTAGTGPGQPVAGLWEGIGQKVSKDSSQVLGAIVGSVPELGGDGDRNGQRTISGRSRALGVAGRGSSRSFREPEPLKNGWQAGWSERSECSPGLPGEVPGGKGGGTPSVLSYTTDNSTALDSKCRDFFVKEGPANDRVWASGCPNALLLKGACDDHSTNRYRGIPCQRRDCEVCGPISRWRIAERIAHGVEQFWPCAWLVLSFAGTYAESPSWKKEASKQLSVFVRILRKKHGIRLEYAATYELTQRGRLHINLIMGPWTYIPQRTLCTLWGARVHVKRVTDRHGMGHEAAKSHAHYDLGTYVTKLSQVVPEEWGRRVSFSKGWPKLPSSGLPRRGSIRWEFAKEMSRRVFELSEREMIEVLPGECAYRDENCDCFEVVSPSSRDGP